MKTTTILSYTITLFGTTFPMRSVLMDSLEAAAMAQTALLNGDMAKSIEANGGSMDIAVKVEVK